MLEIIISQSFMIISPFLNAPKKSVQHPDLIIGTLMGLEKNGYKYGNDPLCSQSTT